MVDTCSREMFGDNYYSILSLYVFDKGRFNMKLFTGKWYINWVIKEADGLDAVEFRCAFSKSLVKDYYLHPAIVYFVHHIPVIAGYLHEWKGRGFKIHLLGEYYIDIGVITRLIPNKQEKQ